MAVEEILMPVRAVFSVCQLGVKAHDCGEELGDRKDEEAGNELRVESSGCGG